MYYCNVKKFRLIDSKDREALLEIISHSCKNYLRFTLEAAFQEKLNNTNEKVSENDLRNLFFGNYLEPGSEIKIYNEVESYSKLEQLMHYYLREYNKFSNAPMDLVLFRFAIEHISR